MEAQSLPVPAVDCHAPGAAATQPHLTATSFNKELVEKPLITDIYQVEDTKFIEGIDMARFWEFKCQESVCMGDVRAYLKNGTTPSIIELFSMERLLFVSWVVKVSGYISYPNNTKLVEDDNVIFFL